MSFSSPAWTWRHAILKSDLPATTRHVLLTVSCWMNDVGDGCYPTQQTLAKATGLTDRAVRKHLDIAENAGWIVRKEHGFRGQKWRNHEYEARWPDILDVEKRAEQGSGPFSEGAERGSGKVRNEVPTILPDTNIPLNPPEDDDEIPSPDVVSRSEQLRTLIALWPDSKVGDQEKVRSAFERLTAADRAMVMDAMATARRAYTRRKHKLPMLATFLRDRLFAEFFEAPVISDDGEFTITPDRPEWPKWIDWIAKRYGSKQASATRERGFFLAKTRWPQEGRAP